LRALSFAERGTLLKDMAKATRHTATSCSTSQSQTGGNTRSDAKFDVDGAIFTLQTYAELGEKLGATKFLLDGEGSSWGARRGSTDSMCACPRHGVAVHINRIQTSLPGGWRRSRIGSSRGNARALQTGDSCCDGRAPRHGNPCREESPAEGALSLLVGAPRDLPDLLGSQDVLAFTGSGDTGVRIRALPTSSGIGRINVEADSLNAAVLGPDAEPGGDMYETFLRTLLRDMTQKAGRSAPRSGACSSPRGHAATVRDDLAEA